MRTVTRSPAAENPSRRPPPSTRAVQTDVTTRKRCCPTRRSFDRVELRLRAAGRTSSSSHLHCARRSTAGVTPMIHLAWRRLRPWARRVSGEGPWWAGAQRRGCQPVGRAQRLGGLTPVGRSAATRGSNSLRARLSPSSDRASWRWSAGIGAAPRPRCTVIWCGNHNRRCRSPNVLDDGTPPATTPPPWEPGSPGAGTRAVPARRFRRARQPVGMVAAIVVMARRHQGRFAQRRW